VFIRISNFKSVENAEFELAPLTILVGPPASGKSNILDAIAFAGYFNRFLLFDKEYESDVSRLEPIQLVLRFTSLEQLFTGYDLTRRILVELRMGSDEVLSVGLQFREGRSELLVNGVVVPWDLLGFSVSLFTEIRDVLSQVARGGLLPEARLYGYDRYGLASQYCLAIFPCGFNMRMKGVNVVPTPKNVLSELGWNGPNIIKFTRDVVVEINDMLREVMDIRVEVKASLSGNVTVYDYDFEVEPVAVSDTVFRALYYLMAIKTSVNYAKLYGLEKKFILLLEEPEAHIFPYYLNILANYIAKAKDYIYIVIATHNPLLTSMLWDKVKDVKTYYVTRDVKIGTTKVFELDIEKLAKELKTSEDLLFMTPHEVVSKYVIQHWEKIVEQKTSREE